MRKFKILPLLLLLLTLATSAAAQKKTQKTYIPWSNGKLVVSEEGRYLKHENGTPFFWLGETGWLLPERLNRDEAEYYLEQCKRRGYNVIQVQTLNNVPSMNIYGQYSMTDGYNFKNINQKGVYGYWDHMDYIIRTAAKKGLYIGMVCIWGSPVSHGEMNVDQAKAYGKFLAERYKDEPNIIWFIGGDIRGDEDCRMGSIGNLHQSNRQEPSDDIPPTWQNDFCYLVQQCTVAGFQYVPERTPPLWTTFR